MRRKTFKTHCPECVYKIDYYPLSGFNGKFWCPHCGHGFKMPVLTDFVEAIV